MDELGVKRGGYVYTNECNGDCYNRFALVLHWVQFLLLISAPVCGFFGGYLRDRQRRVRALAV
jgi:hypothetical protein